MTKAKTREFVFIWDVTMANPNGDMLNENRPRQDEQTGQLEVSDVRIKRFVRDYWIKIGKDVLVKQVLDAKGKVMSCQQIIDGIIKGNSIKEDKIISFLLENYIDVLLFGAVITKPKHNLTGPLQVNWSKSLYESGVEVKQGNAAYASREGKEQASIWTKYMTPYAVFKTNMVFNTLTADAQKMDVQEKHIDLFIEGLVEGLKSYRSTSKNQMPRVLIEIAYKNNKISGDLDVFEYKTDKDSLALRQISEIDFDFSKLNQYMEKFGGNIDSVRMWIDGKVKHFNLDQSGIKLELI